MFEILETTKFNKEEFEKLFEKNPPSFTEESSVKSRTKGTKSTKPENQDNKFIFQGAVWSATYYGKTCQLKDLECIKYIAYLLDKPNYDYQPFELRRIVKGETDNQTSTIIKELTPEDETSLRNILLDAYKEVQNAIKQNDSSEFNKAEKRFKTIKQTLESQYGAIVTEKHDSVWVKFKGGAKYKKATHYDAVKKQIKEGRIKISKAGLPDLADHLKIYIDRFCYRPPPDQPKWNVIFDAP